MTDSQEKQAAEEVTSKNVQSTQAEPKHGRYSWARFKYFFIHTILHADDTPHRIALGFALGLALALTPTVGIQMIIAVIIAWTFRCNKAVCLAMVWVSNPITTPPIYIGGYWLGTILLGSEFDPSIVRRMIGQEYIDGAWVYSGLSFLDMMSNAWDAMVEIFIPLWVGCGLVAIVFSLPSYFIVYKMVVSYRMKKYGSSYIHINEDQIVPTDETGHDLPTDETGHALVEQEPATIFHHEESKKNAKQTEDK